MSPPSPTLTPQQTLTTPMGDTEATPTQALEDSEALLGETEDQG